ncbi:MAG: asparagine synthase-related protein, partial [Streptomyces sp.]
APLAPQRAQHSVLLAARSAGAAARQAARVSAAFGPRLAVPYLDDQVLSAALAVRPEDRAIPGTFKPLLSTAMRGIVPDAVLDRRSQGSSSSADFHEGLRRHRSSLLDLLDQPELARHGLIDAVAARRWVMRPHTDPAALAQLDATLACEMWLRSLNAFNAPLPVRPRTGDPAPTLPHPRPAPNQEATDRP